MDRPATIALLMTSEICDSENSNHRSDLSRMTKQMSRQNEAAYREFFNLYYKRLWAYLITVSKGNFNDVEEAVQLTLIRVVKNIRAFEREDVFWNWLTRLAKSAYIDCYRKQSTFQKLVSSFRQYRENSDSYQTSTSTEICIEQALNRLDSANQQLIRWKYFDNWSYDAIADELGVSSKAIESRLGRARKKLKQLILELARHG